MSNTLSKMSLVLCIKSSIRWVWQIYAYIAYYCTYTVIEACWSSAANNGNTFLRDPYQTQSHQFDYFCNKAGSSVIIVFSIVLTF